VALMADVPGISFIRTTRGKTPVIYGPDEEFRIGGSRVVRSSDDDAVTLIGAGITLHEGARAAERLAGDGIAARVIDLYSVKPVDVETLRAAARATGRFVVAEDHWPEGGLASAVLEAVADDPARPALVSLAVREMPGSGTPEELVAQAGIDAAAIERAARELVAGGGAAPAGATRAEERATPVGGAA
jgi:transketolase